MSEPVITDPLNPNYQPHIESTTTAKPPEPEKPKKPLWRRVLKWLFWFLFITGFIVVPGGAALYYYQTIYPTLPDPNELREVTYQVPLRIETEDGKLITEIGTKKRIPLDYSQIPERMTQAIIAAEDESFFAHGGVDFKGLSRAVYELVTTGKKKSGGSTITMQVARNFFLSREKSYIRKINEIVLSYQIEDTLSKEEILALYLNKIFLGYRSYGVAAAALTYYGRDLKDLTIDEYAMIAGLPKAPSAYNPIINPERAIQRRDYVLRRMKELNFITQQELDDALAVKAHAKKHGPIIEVEADYIAEMARSFALEQFGEDALQNGLTIVTTVDSKLQQSANQAVRVGLQDYERRHGYRGAINTLDAKVMENRDEVLTLLQATNNHGDLKVAVVTGFAQIPNPDPKQKAPIQLTEILLESGQASQIDFATMEWAREYKTVNYRGAQPKKPQDVLKVGDMIYVQWLDNQWQLAQDPLAESALVSLDANDGKVKALVGGFDFFRSKFNRATQGKRQVGSNMKPFLYSAALSKGMTAASTINDAPITVYDVNLEGLWRPENYSGRFYGPTRLRKALAMSRNLVSIRLMQQIEIPYAVDYFKRFGFPLDDKSGNLSLSLGSSEFTPWEVARAYATFANTGFLVDPYFIKEVRGYNGEVIYQAQPKIACNEITQCAEDDPNAAPRVIERRNAYIMTSIMQDVVTYGSGRKAKALERQDIAGKTGTTNDQKDAWFSGFNPYVVTTVWTGFDQPSTLGRSEVGGRASLPTWMAYMEQALAPYPNQPFIQPEGLVTVPVDSRTGQALPLGSTEGVFEVFREEFAPEPPLITREKLDTVIEDLFN